MPQRNLRIRILHKNILDGVTSAIVFCLCIKIGIYLGGREL